MVNVYSSSILNASFSKAYKPQIDDYKKYKLIKRHLRFQQIVIMCVSYYQRDEKSV